MRFVPVPPELLVNLDELPWSVYDSSGQLLLAKGASLKTHGSSIQARGVYFEERFSLRWYREFMQEMEKRIRDGLPLGQIGGSEPKHWRDVWGLSRKLPLIELLDCWATRIHGLLGNYQAEPAWAERLVAATQGAQESLTIDVEGCQTILLLLSSLNRDNYLGWHALTRMLMVLRCAEPLGLTGFQTQSLCCAALSADVAMAKLSGILAHQKEPLTPVQKEQIKEHAAQGRRMLEAAGINDQDWLHIVEHHHQLPVQLESATPPMEWMLGVMRSCDQLAALLSPRADRPALSPAQAMRKIAFSADLKSIDSAGAVVVKALGAKPAGTLVESQSEGWLGAITRANEEVVVLTNTQRMPRDIPQTRKLESPEQLKDLLPCAAYTVRNLGGVITKFITERWGLDQACA